MFSLLLAFEHLIDQRQHKQGQEGRGDQAADDDGRQGPLHFSAGIGREGHGNESQAGDERGHEHGPEPGPRSLADSLAHRQSLVAELIEVGQHDHAVEDGHAEQGDKADRAGEVEIESAQPEGRDSPDHGEGNIHDDDQRMLDRAEHDEEEGKDQKHGQRDDDEEAAGGPFLILELAAPGDEIPGWQGDGGGDFGFGVSDEAADIAAADVALDDDAALVILAADEVGGTLDGDLGDIAEAEALAGRR